MKSVFVKSLIISFSFWYAVFSTATPLFVLAQTEDISTSPTPSPTPTATPAPTSEPAGINLETGDATASATAESDANSSETQVSGNLGGEACSSPEPDCPGDTLVDTEQEALTNTDSSSTSTTGENEIEASGSASIKTGDAASGALTDSQTNTNVVELETGSETEIEEEQETETEGQAVPSPTPTPESLLEVNTEQSATSSAESEALSSTGENIIETNGSLEIVTGAAFALASAINLTNVNLVGSDLFWLIKTILGEQDSSINFYELFSESDMEAMIENLAVNSEATITTNQESIVKTATEADANSGENLGEGEMVEMTTGEAVAVASSVNLANLNFVGSNALVAVVNIAGSLVGDIILPNPKQLPVAGFPWSDTKVISNQEAVVDTGSYAQANTGENSLEGNIDLLTGDAAAVANTYSYANLVRVGDGWGFIILNVFGDWAGSLVNWEEPGSNQTLGLGSHQLEKTWGNEKPLLEQNQPELMETESETGLTIITNQTAEVESQTTSLANTGRNQLQGEGRLTTGDALSLASDFALANFVGVGGSFLFGIFNVLGSWVGDLVVAYPDLEISVTDNLETVTPGSPIEYLITVKNTGQARAENVLVDFSYPQDVVLFPAPSFWQIDYLEPGAEKIFQIGGEVLPTALANSELVAQATVETPDTEETTENNQAQDKTIVILPPQETSGPGEPDTRLPDLKVSVWNNVGDFVYPGDTVLASITVANQSSFVAKSVRVRGELANDHPMPPIPMEWEIGDLKPGERVKIEFEIGLIEELPEGEYHLSAEAIGLSGAGQPASSGWVTSSFLVRLKAVLSLLTEVITPQEETLAASGQVLGVEDNYNYFRFDIEPYLPYILGASVFLLIVISALRRKIEGQPAFPFLPLRKRKREKDD